MGGIEGKEPERLGAQRFDGGDGRVAGAVDLTFGAAHPQAPERAEWLDLDEVDVGGLLGFVCRRDDPRGRLDLEDEEALAGDEHHALAVAVDELGLVRLHRADHLVADHLGPDAVFGLEVEVAEHGVASALDFALVLVVDLEQAEGPLDHLDRGHHAGRLEGHVGDAVDDHARSGLDPERGLPGQGEEAATGRAGEGGELRLERVQEDVATELDGQGSTRVGVAAGRR